MVGAIIFGFAFLLILSVIIIYVLNNKVEELEKDKAITEKYIKIIKESRNNLEDTVDNALKGQLVLLDFIDNFKSFISIENRKIVNKWKTDVLKTKEIYSARFKADRENRETASTNNAEQEDNTIRK